MRGRRGRDRCEGSCSNIFRGEYGWGGLLSRSVVQPLEDKHVKTGPLEERLVILPFETPLIAVEFVEVEEGEEGFS